MLSFRAAEIKDGDGNIWREISYHEPLASLGFFKGASLPESKRITAPRRRFLDARPGLRTLCLPLGMTYTSLLHGEGYRKRSECSDLFILIIILFFLYYKEGYRYGKGEKLRCDNREPHAVKLEEYRQNKHRGYLKNESS